MGSLPRRQTGFRLSPHSTPWLRRLPAVENLAATSRVTCQVEGHEQWMREWPRLISECPRLAGGINSVFADLGDWRNADAGLPVIGVDRYTQESHSTP